MKPPARSDAAPIRVLYFGDGGAHVDALSRLLLERGHDVRVVAGLGELLGIERRAADVLVLDAALHDGVRDLLLLEELVSAGVGFPIVLVTGRPDFEHCRRALELGAVNVVQGSFEPGPFVQAVEAAWRPAGPRPVERSDASDAAPSPRHLVEYPAEAATTRTAIRDLLGFLARLRVSAPHVARICGATAELVENACLHAYDDGSSGRVEVEAEVEGAGVTVRVRDAGRGLDAGRLRLDSVRAALPAGGTPDGAHRTAGGLSRAALLADRLDLTSDAGETVVELGFALSPVSCGPRETQELPAIDDLLPETVRERLERIRTGLESLQGLPPALSFSMLRLVGNASSTPTAIQG